MFTEDKDVGYVCTPGFEGYIQREEFNTKVSINTKGLRGKEYGSKEDSIYRILFLGDSFAFGFGVEENETSAVQLEAYLNKGNPGNFEVLNAGVPGYGTVDQLNFLKSRGSEINPDLVILQFLSDNDFEENRFPAKVMVEKKNDNSISDTTPLWKNIEFWLKTHFHSIKFLSERIGFLMLKSGLMGENMKKSFWGEYFSEDDEKLFERTIIELFNYTRELNSDFVFLYVTGQGQVLSEKEPELKSEILIKKIMSENKIDWINIFRIMRRNDKKSTFYYPIDGHWKSAGHKFVAEILYNMIIKDNIFYNSAIN